jgi:hypothetical protein
MACQSVEVETRGKEKKQKWRVGKGRRRHAEKGKGRNGVSERGGGDTRKRENEKKACQLEELKTRGKEKKQKWRVGQGRQRHAEKRKSRNGVSVRGGRDTRKREKVEMACQ